MRKISYKYVVETLYIKIFMVIKFAPWVFGIVWPQTVEIVISFHLVHIYTAEKEFFYIYYLFSKTLIRITVTGYSLL